MTNFLQWEQNTGNNMPIKREDSWGISWNCGMKCAVVSAHLGLIFLPHGCEGAEGEEGNWTDEKVKSFNQCRCSTVWLHILLRGRLNPEHQPHVCSWAWPCPWQWEIPLLQGPGPRRCRWVVATEHCGHQGEVSRAPLNLQDHPVFLSGMSV